MSVLYFESGYRVENENIPREISWASPSGISFDSFLIFPRIFLLWLQYRCSKWESSLTTSAEMQKEGDAGDAVSAHFFDLCKFVGFALNFWHNFSHFCTISSGLCKFLQIFAHFMHTLMVLIFLLKVLSVLFFKLFAILLFSIVCHIIVWRLTSPWSQTEPWPRTNHWHRWTPGSADHRGNVSYSPLLLTF